MPQAKSKGKAKVIAKPKPVKRKIPNTVAELITSDLPQDVIEVQLLKIQKGSSVPKRPL